LKLKVAPTKFVRVLGIDKRSVEDLLWCAISFGVTRVFWVDGFLLCIEVYEKAFEYEVEKGFFPISQVCYTPFPSYARVYEVKGAQIPIVNVSEMELYQKLVKEVKKRSLKPKRKNK
jgi:hypothetical protein